MQVIVRDNNVDQALKALKKKMQREGIFREMKLRNHYEKPSEKKAREKAEGVRRARKLARKRAQREGLIPSKQPRALILFPRRALHIRGPILHYGWHGCELKMRAAHLPSPRSPGSLSPWRFRLPPARPAGLPTFRSRSIRRPRRKPTSNRSPR